MDIVEYLVQLNRERWHKLKFEISISLNSFAHLNEARNVIIIVPLANTCFRKNDVIVFAKCSKELHDLWIMATVDRVVKPCNELLHESY
jgi:hypothetical protein